MPTPPDVIAALNAFNNPHNNEQRLYWLDTPDPDNPLAQLTPLRFARHDKLDEPWLMLVQTISPNHRLDHHRMPGQRLTLNMRLADGSAHALSGMVTQATRRSFSRELAAYDLTVESPLALLRHRIRSDVWKDRTLTEIVDSVLSHYGALAWRWADDVQPYLQAGPAAGVLAYLVQHREDDLSFLRRLLAPLGIGMRFEHCPDAPMGDRIVFFADSPSSTSCPEDATSASPIGGLGIRFHREASVEEQDAIQALGRVERLPVAVESAVGWDPLTKRVISGSVPTVLNDGGPNAPRLEAYRPQAGFSSQAEADYFVRLAMESTEAQQGRQIGRSTVRTLRPGTTAAITGSVLDATELLDGSPQDMRFLLTSVVSAGVNNLPHTVAENVKSQLPGWPAWVSPEVRRQAEKSGYGNAFEAIPALRVWRPRMFADDGQALHPKPRMPDMIATVVGPNGEKTAEGADEIHVDRLGRVRIQYDFQDLYPSALTAKSSIWVRVAQRYGAMQWTPRIGHQVVVQHLNGDPDRPVVLASCYTGRGEGGVQPTPGGGEAVIKTDSSVFGHASDHRPSGQGNLTGGNSPAWHAASGDDKGHRNAGAFSGYKTKEFGGEGYNQLVFDDTDGQLRVQLATTQYGTQLNMGHLIHQADNYRGSFRGLGFEMRTDAWGVVRGGRGVLISTFGIDPSDPAGDNAAGMALVKQMMTLAEVFNGAAKTHEVVQLSGHIGSFGQLQCGIDDKAAVLAALHKAVKGMVSEASLDAATSDAAKKSNSTAEGMLPHTTDPIVAISAQGGFAVAAGQDVQIAAGENVVLASGKDTNVAVGGAARIHAGQAVGILAGAIQPGRGAAGTGVTLIAGHGDVDLQAQAGPMQIASSLELFIRSKVGDAVFAAAKRIVIATAGGASITMENGNITVECPGKITVNAGKKSFLGPQNQSYPMPKLPRVPITTVPAKFQMRLRDVPGSGGLPVPDTDWRIVAAQSQDAALGSTATILAGTSDSDGRIHLSATQEKTLHEAYNRDPNGVWMVFNSQVRELALSLEHDEWADQHRLYNALDAMGYADDYDIVGDASVDEFFAMQARTELKANTPQGIYNKLRDLP